MLVLHSFDFLLLLCHRLGVDVGIFPVQCGKDFRDGLCEYARVWMNHAREVLVLDSFFDLSLQRGFDEVDIVEFSELLIVFASEVGDLCGCESSKIGYCGLDWAIIWEIWS